MTQDRCLLG